MSSLYYGAVVCVIFTGEKEKKTVPPVSLCVGTVLLPNKTMGVCVCVCDVACNKVHRLGSGWTCIPAANRVVSLFFSAAKSQQQREKKRKVRSH